MKLTGTYNGKPIELELTEEQVESLRPKRKKTGWERVEKGEKYFKNWETQTWKEKERGESLDSTHYEYANYFTSETIAQNILRAQELQRKLWRRSAELCEKVDWNDNNDKFSIYYDCETQSLFVQALYIINGFGHVYFDTREHAEQVIEEFKDELIWYFTEFKSRMD